MGRRRRRLGPLAPAPPPCVLAAEEEEAPPRARSGAGQRPAMSAKEGSKVLLLPPPGTSERAVKGERRQHGGRGRAGSGGRLPSGTPRPRHFSGGFPRLQPAPRQRGRGPSRDAGAGPRDGLEGLWGPALPPAPGGWGCCPRAIAARRPLLCRRLALLGRAALSCLWGRLARVAHLNLLRD